MVVVMPIEDCAPTKITTEGPEYITDSEVEYSDNDKDNIVEINGSWSEESEVSETQKAGSKSTPRKQGGKPAKKARKIPR